MSRWIIVSNRLPFSYDKKSKSLKGSSGGLVTALNGVKSKNPLIWLGSLPRSTPKEAIALIKKTQGKMSYAPLIIEDQMYDDYYNGFCNDVLWPALHYETEFIKYKTKNWETYKQVNEIFAKEIIKIAKKDDVIWIHDFHLFLVPKLLKEKKPNLKVGFFLHIPFPSSEIYRQLPCREEILESLIKADLIGFHDYSYLRHFCSSVYSITGIQSSMLEIIHGNHRAKLGVYPVSIDTQNFIKKAEAKKTAKNIDRFQFDKRGIGVILGVDRLDYTKGIIHKLKSFKDLLEQHPEYRGKLQLVQVAVPSRTEVPEYINLRNEVERLVGEINGKYSTINYIPVKYIFKSIDIYELMALYRSADILFVTSKRDGMNLVCLEYIAAQKVDNPGVVVLSEFAGAAAMLSQATLVNPMNIRETANTLASALQMPLHERVRRHSIMLDFLKDYTATDWANAFTKDLNNTKINIVEKIISLNKSTNKKKVQIELQKSDSILLLDYDGTLTPICNKPEQAVISKRTKGLLSKLSKKDGVEVVVVSGRPIDFLKQQLKGLDVFIAGEHGGKFFDYKQSKWRTLVSSNKNKWFNQALEIIHSYTKRTPNSFYEKKNFAITWHYRNSPVDFAEFQAKRLVTDLEASLSNFPVSVIFGKKVIEVKALEANKGYFANWFTDRYHHGEKIIAMGDDRTDEDMFSNLKNKAITIKIGKPDNTYAKYYITEQKDVDDFLKGLL